MPDAFAAIMLCARAVGAEGVEVVPCLWMRGDLLLAIRGTWQQAQALRFALWQDGRLEDWRVDVVAWECGP